MKTREEINAAYSSSPKGKQVRWEHEDKRQRRFVEFLAVHKDKPCMDCGQRFPPCCMDFDHRPGEVKSFGISTSRSRSFEVILAEIKKCDVVCSNCHRLRTADRNVQREYWQKRRLGLLPENTNGAVQLNLLGDEESA
jgi:hypothetical protein